MKVLHVIPSISEKSGGPGQAIFPMCRALRDADHDVLLAATDAELGKDQEFELGREFLLQGLPVILFHKQFADSFKYSPTFSRWLDESVAEFDVVHIHAVFNHSCIAAARACRKHRVPYIVRPLGTLDPWSMSQKNFRKQVFWRLGVKTMLESAAAIHYTASGEQEAVEKFLNLKNGFVAPLGVDVEEASAATQLGKFLDVCGHPYVLALSRLHPKKELETLIEAFLAAVTQPGLSQWRLVIAGDGDAGYVNYLKEVAGHKSPGSPVVFTGWLQGERKEQALRNAALVVLISRQENFGLCIAEAMARSVPVLVSPQVNLAVEIEQSGAGWVSPIDKGKLQDVLGEVMMNDTERSARGNAGRALAVDRFNWKVIARQLSAVYSSLLERRMAATDIHPRADAARTESQRDKSSPNWT